MFKVGDKVTVCAPHFVNEESAEILAHESESSSPLVLLLRNGNLYRMPVEYLRFDPYAPKCLRCDGPRDTKFAGDTCLACVYAPHPGGTRMNPRKPPPDPPDYPSLSPGAIRGRMGSWGLR